MQVGKFLKNIKLAGQNRRAGGKIVFKKTLNVQEGFFSKLINVNARLFSTLEYLNFSALLVLKWKKTTPMVLQKILKLGIGYLELDFKPFNCKGS